MSTNYKTSFEAFSLFSPAFEHAREVYKDYVAPIFRRGADGSCTDPGTFGLVPRKRIPAHVKPYDTMNARGDHRGEAHKRLVRERNTADAA
jgi:hypothetical protein